jgi:cytidine deaminase
MEDFAELLGCAREARVAAYASYSGFAVGAALQAAGGQVFCGCNVENASYGLTVCAERVALFAAVAAGVREFSALAVVADSPEPVAPCGACRQVLYEFAPDLQVILANLQGRQKKMRLRDLLPEAFDNSTFELMTSKCRTGKRQMPEK